MSTRPVPLPPCDHQPKPYVGAPVEEILRLRKQYLHPSWKMFYREPFYPVEGHMQYLWNDKGERFLDFFAGIVTVSVGHCHPRTVKARQILAAICHSQAAKAQLDKLWHTTPIYLTMENALFAKELVAKLPDSKHGGHDDWVIYFVNSGSEANDLAMLMARLYTRSFPMISLRNGYHGMSEGTRGLTAVGSWKYDAPGGPGVFHAQCPDVYRGLFNGPDAGAKYAQDVADIVHQSCGGSVAGFICETIQGVGGTIMLPDGYLPAVYDTIRKAGGVCIADEVQGGFGRTGTHYWSFQRHGVVPDMITMAKGIGNGVPLAAVAARRPIAEALTRKGHFNTFGGNPVVCAVGREVLRIMDDDNLMGRCKVLGDRLMSGLKELQSKHAVIGDVRGVGLMVGIELVKNRHTKQPAVEETAEAMERMKNMGLLVGRGGAYGTVLRLKPPMCITEADVDFALRVMDLAFEGLAPATPQLPSKL